MKAFKRLNSQQKSRAFKLLLAPCIVKRFKLKDMQFPEGTAPCECVVFDAMSHKSDIRNMQKLRRSCSLLTLKLVSIDYFTGALLGNAFVFILSNLLELLRHKG